jgi:hypothetical protein
MKGKDLSPDNLRKLAGGRTLERTTVRVSSYPFVPGGVNRKTHPTTVSFELRPDEARALAAALDEMAEVAEARQRLASDLAVGAREMPAPAGKIWKGAATRTQKHLRSVLARTRVFLDGDFRQTIAASFDQERGDKPWTPKYKTWYRNLKDRTRNLHQFLSGFEGDFFDVDGLVKVSKDTLAYLQNETWRAGWLQQAGLYDQVREQWAKAIELLEADIRDVEIELRRQGREPERENALPYPPLTCVEAPA